MSHRPVRAEIRPNAAVDADHRSPSTFVRDVDEVILASGRLHWMHLEQMGDNRYWMGLGWKGNDYALRLWIRVRRGEVEVTVE